MDNYFIDIHISPQNGHYCTSLFPLFLPIYLQHLRCNDNGISLTPTTVTFFTHMIWKDKYTYLLSIPINALYTTNTELNSLLMQMLTDRKHNNLDSNIVLNKNMLFPWISIIFYKWQWSTIFLVFCITDSSHHVAQNNPGHSTKIL